MGEAVAVAKEGLSLGTPVSLVPCSVGDKVAGTERSGVGLKEGISEPTAVGSEEGINDGAAVTTRAAVGATEETTSTRVGDKVASEGSLDTGISVGAKVSRVGDPVVTIGASVGLKDGGDVVNPSVGNVVISLADGESVVVAIIGLNVGDRVSSASVKSEVGAPVGSNAGSVDNKGGETSSVGAIVLLLEGSAVWSNWADTDGARSNAATAKTNQTLVKQYSEKIAIVFLIVTSLLL